MKYFFEILILVIPAVLFALWNGRNGLVHPNSRQVIIIGFIIIVCSFIVVVMRRDEFNGASFNGLISNLQCLAVSITGYGLLFPYAFNYMWFRKFFGHEVHLPIILKYIVNHLSEDAIPDKWFLKYNVHWIIRLLLYLVFFVGAIILFVK